MGGIDLRFWVGGVVLPAIFSFGAQAAEPPAADLRSLSNSQLEQRFKTLYGADDTSACRDILPALTEMIARKSFDPSYTAFKLRFDLQCAIDEKRYDEAYVLLIQNEKVNGPVVAPIATVMIAFEAKQYAPAIDRLIAAAGKPADAGGLADPFNNFRWLDGKLEAADRQDFALMLNQRFLNASVFRTLPDRSQDFVRENLFRREVEAGHVEAARPLLASITEPYWYFRLLSDRRYAAFWPELERRAGPNMSTAFAVNIDRARAELRSDPKNVEKLSDLATALNEAGYYDEVLTLTQEFAKPEALAMLGEFHFWALDARVNALDGLGREAEASGLFDAMAAIPFDAKKNGWLVNFVANRSGRLSRMTEWDKTLAASERAAFVANQYGSAYVKQIIASDRACALAMLGRKDELPALLAKIESDRASDPAATVQALQCAGQDDRAAEIVIESLRDPDLRTDMLRNLQGQEFTTLAGRTGAEDQFPPLKQRPDVAAVYNEVGRDLPPSLITPAGTRWLERQAPGRGSGG
jgi:hypothetical protein